MEYRDIRYTVRARILRDEWTVSIHPADIESSRRVVTGREEAELLARSMIDSWHETRGAERSKSEPAKRTYVSKHGTVATMNIVASTNTSGIRSCPRYRFRRQNDAAMQRLCP